MTGGDGAPAIGGTGPGTGLGPGLGLGTGPGLTGGGGIALTTGVTRDVRVRNGPLTSKIMPVPPPPRWEAKYIRLPRGLNVTPVISEVECDNPES